MSYRFYKRAGDLLFVLLAVSLCWWLFAILILLYAVMGQSPVLFKHVRTGKDGIPFGLYKFRTLLSDESLPLQQRTFGLGNFLRKTSLDELPQLWNVWKGEMSVVGPRPLPIAYDALYTTTQRERHRVLPGITGLAQVTGRHTLSWQKKFEWDVFYVNHLTLWLDMKILLKTVPLVLVPKKDVSLKEEAFKG